METFDKYEEKKEVHYTKKNDNDYAPGWDAITDLCNKVYPNQENPKHYGTLISWKNGGNDPFKGISIYDGGDYWHFITYGLSELYEKESDIKDVSGYGMEFTFKLKKDNYENEENEIKCICGILQSIARITFTTGEVFKSYEYLYTGQTEGIDVNGKSNITGFITIPDNKFHELYTQNGKVEFVEFIGVTDEELNAIKNKQITVEELYEKIGSDITNYNRNSVISSNQDTLVNKNKDFSKIVNDNDIDTLVKLGQLKWIYVVSPVFGGIEDKSNQILVTPKAEKEKESIDEELLNFLKQGKTVQNFNIDFEYKGKSAVVSKIMISAIVDGNDYNKTIEVW